jgi:hypothetical protein
LPLPERSSPALSTDMRSSVTSGSAISASTALSYASAGQAGSTGSTTQARGQHKRPGAEAEAGSAAARGRGRRSVGYTHVLLTQPRQPFLTPASRALALNTRTHTLSMLIEVNIQPR